VLNDHLITNAAKYNDDPMKRIEIGYLDEVRTKDGGVEREVLLREGRRHRHRCGVP
jgi:hypothetical protein